MNKDKHWKAWVDTMPGPGSKPRLHVHGDINLNDKAKYSLVPGNIGINPKILILDVTPKPSEGETSTHLEYHEDLSDAETYTQVTIREINEVTIDVETAS